MPGKGHQSGQHYCFNANAVPFEPQRLARLECMSTEDPDLKINEDMTKDDGTAAVVGGSADERMAEGERLQHIPRFVATANAPGSCRPCSPLPCALCS